ncbi:hypothetical protein [Aquimarina sp. 2201CG5-10]|uniref:hypothetical protein n=1 Tax=Aquimarina callyspongiae TaxID=3098150 RepID=UPI002AB51064|nr:hypothetical protein [Aquimarina sp. 2201CG5-10]MDY8137211.1 hypothetical protein [Aquimarina sp. 2201CG5-10]
MKRLLLYLLILFSGINFSCSDTEREKNIEKIKVGDSIKKVESIFGKPDQFFSTSKKTFPYMKNVTEDTIYIKYYRATDWFNSNGVKIYCDSKVVLYIEINDW